MSTQEAKKKNQETLKLLKKEKKFMNRKSIDALLAFERNLKQMGGGSRKSKKRTTRRKRAKRQTSK